MIGNWFFSVLGLIFSLFSKTILNRLLSGPTT